MAATIDINEFAKKYHGLIIQPHQRELFNFLQGVKHRGIALMPRGHTKTTTTTQLWLSYIIAQNPWIRVLLISNSKEMAEGFSRTVRNVMENPDLQAEFGFTNGTPWRADSWRLEESPQSKPTVECKGVMGRMTGWRGDLVIFDDPLEITGVANENIRRKVEMWIRQEVMPAINPHPVDKIIVIGTRKHIDDWYAQLLVNSEYEQYIRPAFLNKEETESLWPYLLDEQGNRIAEMWSPARLKAKRREIGALLFAQEYMNQPAPPEGLEMKYEWLKFYEHLPDRPLKYYMGVDPSAGKKNTQSEYAVAIVAHDDAFDTIYVTDLYKGALTKREQVQKTFEYATRHMAMEAIFIENVFEYTHVYEAMVGQFPNVQGKDYIHTPISGTNVVKKEERIKNILAPAIEQGRLLFLNPVLDQFTRKFIEEEYVPFPTGYMDMLDALTLAVHSLVGTSRITEIPWVFY